MSQLTLDDAQAAALEGMERAAVTAGEEWRDYARRFVYDYCRTHREVFIDDLWAAGLLAPEDGSKKAMGGVMRHASGRWMRKAGYRGSVASHGSPKPFYLSTVYEGGE